MGTAGGVALAATNAAPGHHPLAIVTQTYCRRWMSSGQPGTMHRILARFFLPTGVGCVLRAELLPIHPVIDRQRATVEGLLLLDDIDVVER